MTSRADPPDGAISYGQWLTGRISEPGRECGPPVFDDRRWWEHLPWLNPYAELEARARQASKAARAGVQHQAEAEAG